MMAAAVLALAGAAVAAEPDGHKQQVFAWWRGYEAGPLAKTPDGRKLRYFCQGAGSPTVVLESGLGSGAWGWRMVQPQISKTTRVCSYDRAGYGVSDAAKDSRDIEALAADLGVVVKAAGGGKPVILVGHSMGGPIVRQFAYHNPKLVAGLVLVDPSADHQMERFSALNPAFGKIQEITNNGARHCAELLEKGPITASMPEFKLCITPAPQDMPLDLMHFHDAYNQSPVHLRAMLAEQNALSPASGQEVDAARHSLGDTPMIILSAGQLTRAPGFTDDDDRRITALWRQMHWEMTGLSSHARRRFVEGASHTIQVDRPQAVIDAVNEVVAEARRR
jgi:pimeloyl-ACP methyl ester carboxylesterase